MAKKKPGRPPVLTCGQVVDLRRRFDLYMRNEATELSVSLSTIKNCLAPVRGSFKGVTPTSSKDDSTVGVDGDKGSIALKETH